MIVCRRFRENIRYRILMAKVKLIISLPMQECQQLSCLLLFYWENLLYFGAGPTRGQDGVLAITFPMGDKKLSGIAAEDIGQMCLCDI